MIPTSPTDRVCILMYHSVSDGAGPVCVRPEAFRQQLQVLSALGYHAIALRDYLAWHRGEAVLPARCVVLTFDDGYADFATTVFPELQSHGFGATIFLPTKFIGTTGSGPATSNPTRRFMSWEDVASLGASTVELGSHGVNHTDLSSLSLADACREMDASRSSIEDRTGRVVVSFAPPFGRTNARVRSQLAARFHGAVGTRLGTASNRSDLFDLPRIEMCYFRDPGRLRTFLERGGGAYYAIRKLLRGIRHSVGRRGTVPGFP